jgi:hypothetical protein
MKSELTAVCVVWVAFILSVSMAPRELLGELGHLVDRAGLVDRLVDVRLAFPYRRSLP